MRNGKYFVAAQQSDKPFKTLFAELAALGAGRPVDENGFPDGPWTAETLTDAICALEGNEKGIELRTVQRWFQDNDQGIHHTNIRWLARIFGCEDQEEVGKWQAVLSAREGPTNQIAAGQQKTNFHFAARRCAVELKSVQNRTACAFSARRIAHQRDADRVQQYLCHNYGLGFLVYSCNVGDHTRTG